jgi:mono/diheme cytochrome c family protein
MRKTALLAATIASAVPLAQSMAQDIGRPSRGLELARQLCAQCHAVETRQAWSPNDNAPRFEAVASVPGMTAIALTVALTTSHRAMPNIVLSAEDRSDIIAYILSLK